MPSTKQSLDLVVNTWLAADGAHGGMTANDGHAEAKFEAEPGVWATAPRNADVLCGGNNVEPRFRKAGSTLRSSQAVPHPSTNRALCRLTSEVGRDPVHSTRYGRQRTWSRINYQAA